MVSKGSPKGNTATSFPAGRSRRYFRPPYEFRLQVGQLDARTLQLTVVSRFPGYSPQTHTWEGVSDREGRLSAEMHTAVLHSLQDWIEHSNRDRVESSIWAREMLPQA